MSAITITGGNATLNLNRTTASAADASLVASVAAQVPKTSAAAPLLVKIVQNLERDPSNEKFRSINLEGKAGAKLVS